MLHGSAEMSMCISTPNTDNKMWPDVSDLHLVTNASWAGPTLVSQRQKSILNVWIGFAAIWLALCFNIYTDHLL